MGRVERELQALQTDDLHFDYALQVWVQYGEVIPCSHPASMQNRTPVCCNASPLKYGGRKLSDVS